MKNNDIIKINTKSLKIIVPAFKNNLKTFLFRQDFK